MPNLVECFGYVQSNRTSTAVGFQSTTDPMCDDRKDISRGSKRSETILQVTKKVVFTQMVHDMDTKDRLK